VGLVAQAHPFDPPFARADHFALAEFGPRFAKKAQHILAPKSPNAMMDQARVEPGQGRRVFEEHIGGKLRLAGRPVITLPQRPAQLRVQRMRRLQQRLQHGRPVRPPLLIQ
jgi:hypothetical protein